MKSYPYVLVEWDDAHSATDDVYTIDGIDDHQPMQMRSRGLLLRDDDVGLTLSSEDYQDNGEQYFRGHQFIPRGMVRQVTVLSKVRRARKIKAGE